MRATHTLTPEMELLLHLNRANEYWREDRLDLAQAAIHAALRVGVQPGGWYDLQRTIEAEAGARRAGSRLRVAEHLTLEVDPGAWGDYWPELKRAASAALRDITTALDVRWGMPILLTLIPDEGWVEFMHARYGYYVARTASHKVCLPPSATHPVGILRRGARHEIAHAAVHQLAGDDVPRWLDEGVAVLLEGGSPADEVRRYRIAVAKGERPRLDELSGGFESRDMDLGGARSMLYYAAAGEFAQRLADQEGLAGLRRFLAAIGNGRRVDRAFRDVYGVSLGRAETLWRRATGP